MTRRMNSRMESRGEREHATHGVRIERPHAVEPHGNGRSSWPVAAPLALALVGACCCSHAFAQTAVGWGASGGWWHDGPRPVAEISGSNEQMAIRYADGTIAVRGLNRWGVGDPPIGLGFARSISVSATRAIAVRADGSAVQWGCMSQPCAPPAGIGPLRSAVATSHGIYGLGLDGLVRLWRDTPVTTVILQGMAELRGFSDSSGEFSLLVRDTDGRHAAFASAISSPTDAFRLIDEFPSGGVVAIGRAHAIHLDASGVVRGSGLGQPSVPAAALVPADLGACVSIAAGSTHSVALRTDGSVRAWGTGPAVTDAAPKASAPLRAVHACGETSIAETMDGTLLFWGATQVVGIPGSDEPLMIIDVAGGSGHTLTLDASGTVHAWGSNGSGQCDVPDGLPAIRQVGAGRAHSVALATDGSVHAWGSSLDGAAVVPPDLGRVMQVACGESHTLALTASGSVRAWGNDYYGQVQVPNELGSVQALAAGVHHSLAVRADGAVRGWGRNAAGQCDAPATVGAASQVAGGLVHSMALRLDGTVACWGDSTAGSANTPPELGDVIAIAAGRLHSMALRSNGVVVAWGRNLLGETRVPQLEAPVLAIRALGDSSVAIVDLCPDTPARSVPTSCGCPDAEADFDGDRIPDCVDNCTFVANLGQEDCDLNGTGDACDAAAGVDCNSNGIADTCEVLIAGSDTDSDGRVDDCERARGDLNLDGVVNQADLAMLQAEWGESTYDLTGDGAVNSADITVLLLNWGAVD